MHRMEKNWRKKPRFCIFYAKNSRKICRLKKMLYFCTRNSGCSSARLEYASGGRVVAGSNPVTPTGFKGSKLLRQCAAFFVLLPLRTELENSIPPSNCTHLYTQQILSASGRCSPPLPIAFWHGLKAKQTIQNAV